MNANMSRGGLCASAPAALLGSAVLAAQFVLSLYVCTPRGRPPNRDDPAVVKARFVRVGVASIIAPFVSILAAALPGDTEPCMPDASLLQWFGLWAPERVGAAVFAPLLLTVILFLGPLVMAWIEECDTPWQLRLRQMVHAHRDVRSLRNLLIGPLAEEWVFRACMCSLLYGAGIRDGTNVFISGTLFGLAHVHHVYDAGASLAVVGVQFTYTSLFGAYSSYLFLRTGLIYGPFLAHSFCNSQGLPRFGDVPGHPHQRVLTAAFLLGLGSFITLVTLDAIYRPPLFHSMLWDERV